MALRRRVTISGAGRVVCGQCITWKFTVKFVEVVVGRLTDDFAVETANEALILAHFGRLHQALPAFQVRLSIDRQMGVR